MMNIFIFSLVSVILSFSALADDEITAPTKLPTPSALPHMLVQAPLWANLDAQQKKILRPLETVFDQLPATQRNKWIALVPKYEIMSPNEQLNAKKHMKNWAQLPVDQKRNARIEMLRYTEEADEPPDPKLWELWRSMSTDERKKIIE